MHQTIQISNVVMRAAHPQSRGRAVRTTGFGIALTALLALCLVQIVPLYLFAQDQLLAPAAPESATAQSQPHPLRLEEFEELALLAVRKDFPRLPGFSAASHSCRLPDYGPLISIAVQPPAYYFTRPILLELERRQRIAEEQARRMRMEIDRASQIITLKAREAVLMEQIESERARKKNSSKADDMEKNLTEVRKAISAIDTQPQEQLQTVIVIGDPLREADLNKLMLSNYQQLVDRLGNAMKNTLAENAPLIEDLKSDERVCITAHIGENFTANHEKSMIFVLNAGDIQAFKKGSIDLPQLKQRVITRVEDKQ
jgi:hypothetical protein